MREQLSGHLAASQGLPMTTCVRFSGHISFAVNEQALCRQQTAHRPGWVRDIVHELHSMHGHIFV